MAGGNFDKSRATYNISTTTGYCSDPTLSAGFEEEVEAEDRWTDLQLAARDGNLAALESLLSDPSTNVNAPPVGWYGQNALQAACAQGHASIVARLIAAGADVDAAGDFNRPRTALQVACLGGNSEIVDMLIAAGADVNGPVGKYSGRTTLQAAAEGGHLHLIEKLLAKGADIDAHAAHYGGLTALQAACSSTSNIDVVRALISAGANVNARPSRYFGLTALQNASLHGNSEAVSELLDHDADPNAAGAYTGGGTALLAAAEYGYVEVVKKLLGAGAIIDTVSGAQKETAIQAAARNYHVDVVDTLEAATHEEDTKKLRRLSVRLDAAKA